jgi:ATP-binding cassette subfamily B protein
VATVLGNKPVLSEALSLLDDSFDEVERFHTDRPADFESVLECVDLVFRYEESEPLVLDGVHLRIEKGTTVGLVGETGSGKSTLLDLLMGLLRPTTGSVMLDSSPLEGNAVGAWRRAIAHVPQDIYLADASIAQNIAFGVPDRQIDMNQVRESARLAHVDEFVEEEALQYETRVGERGIRLSGGQKQRIGIARALYKGVSVLILDEATSALDSVTERSVMEGIASSGEEITVIMVAHRLTTLLDCDRIFEMRDGKIIAEGRFEDLMKHSVSFRELARSLPEAN